MNEEYEKALRARRRRLILVFLQGSVDERASEQILRTLVGNSLVRITAERLRSDLDDLQQMDLIATEMVGDVMFAILRQKGKDVAEGIRVVPGIDKPDTRG